ncbi:Lipase family protein, partial [Reticulomyxa filosa]
KKKKKKISQKLDSNDEFVRYSVVRPRDTEGTAYVVFRGSQTTTDWLSNLNAMPLKVKEYGFRVHSGMHAQLQHKALEELIDLFLTEKLVITGHSLGAGYAVLAAADLLGALGINYPMAVYTFGAPLVIEKNAAIISAIGRILEKIVYNFVNQFDVIPRLQTSASFPYLSNLIGQTVDLILKGKGGIFALGATFLDFRRLGATLFKDNCNLEKLHELCQQSYGPIGNYYLLFDKYLPCKVSKSEIYVRMESEKLLSLLPKYKELHPLELHRDHRSFHYYCKIAFLEMNTANNEN